MENRTVDNNAAAVHMIEIEVCPREVVTIESYSEGIKHEPKDENVYQEEVDVHESEYLEEIVPRKYESVEPGISGTLTGGIEQNTKPRKRYNTKAQKQKTVQIKSLVCPECSKCFRYLSDLKRHSVTHTKEKPFTCDICQKRFNRAFNLKDHLKIHCGVKRYYCNLCDKKFYRLFDLKIHTFIHNGVRPYKCTVCEKDFSNSSNLSKHIRIHSR